MNISDLVEFQAAVGEWHRHNFPLASMVEVGLKLAEEVGELAHACSHLYSGIGERDKLLLHEYDAVGDIMVVLAAYCEMRHLNLQECIDATWVKVSKRDWQADPVQGGKQREVGGGD